jgi:hypothetical protein
MKPRSLYAILTLCLVLVAVLPLVAQEAPVESEAQPKAVVAEPVFDAGKVNKGAQVAHDFVIRNEGRETLEIIEVHPACGCTVADYDASIAPGESGKIHAVVDTTEFAGGISKGMTVLTNDPDNPRLVLTMKATVEPAIYLRPGFARFIQAQNSDPGRVEQIIFTRDLQDLEISGVESPYPFLKADVRPATDEEKLEDGTGKQWVVTLTLDYSQAPVGPLADYVRLATNHPKQNEVQIPVSGFIRPMMVFTPEAADFGQIKVDGNTGATVLLKSFANDEIDVSVDAASLPPGVDVEVRPVEEGRSYNVVITLGPELPTGSFDEVIRLNTGHPKQPVVELPLRGTRI